MKKLFSCLAAIAALFVFTAHGLFAESSEIDKVVVTATRSTEDVFTVPGNITVIDGEDIWESAAVDLGDVLQKEVGISIVDYGAPGATKSVKIRGASNAQVLVLLNGLRLNDSRQGGANLANIPLDSIERIEIVRGAGSSLYGADAVGGVINIITKSEANGKLNIRVQNTGYLPSDAVIVKESAAEKKVALSAVDLVDTQVVLADWSREIGVVDLVLSGSFTRAANAFIWYDDDYIDDNRKRDNADLMAGDAYLSAKMPLGEGVFGINGDYRYADAGSPGTLDPSSLYLSSKNRQQNISTGSQIFWKTDQFFTDLLTFDSKAFYRFERLEYRESSSTSIHDLHSAGIDIVQEFLAEEYSLIYGGNFAVDAVSSTKLDRKNRFRGGVFLEIPLYIGEYATLIPSSRYDFYSDFDTAYTYKIAMVLGPIENLSIKASHGTSFRAPTFNDLFWPKDTYSSGNPDLTPEKGVFGELGAVYENEYLLLSGFGFIRHLSNEIAWVETSTWFYEPMNIGEVLYPGFELESSVEIIDLITISAGYTFLHSYVLKTNTTTYSYQDDKRAIYTPVHSIDAAVGFNNSVTSVMLTAEYNSEVYTDTANTKSTMLDGYFVLNAGTRQKFSDNFSVSVDLNNILNTVYYSKADYVMLPFSMTVAVDMEF